MNKKNITILFFAIVIATQFVQTVKASQYFPNIYYFKPSKDEPYAATPSITFSAGFANTAFNKQGETVPFLSQYGPEDFLERFINPSLGPDNLDSAGQGNLTADFHFKQFRFAYEKSIYHHLIFGTIFTFQDLAMTNIKAHFLPNEYPLQQNQIQYLQEFSQTIPQTVTQSGLYQADFYIGYNEKIIDFNHIKSFNVMLVADISAPQSMRCDNTSVLQFPLSANFFFGFPVVGAMNVEVTDWFTFGLSGLVVPLKSTTMSLPINKTSENNHILFSQTTQARLDQKPFFSGTIYTEINKPSQGLKGTICYSYSQYLKSKITPMDLIQFPLAHANRSLLRDGDSLGSLLLQIEKDCTNEDKKMGPIVSFFIVIPIAGQFSPKTYIFGGACNFEISYAF